jgi:lysozyme
MTTGVDVSSHQGTVDWPPVRSAGYEFAIIKATEGVGYVSPALDSQWRGANDAGLMTGLYAFARPDTNAPEPEADHFAAHVNRLAAKGPGHLPPCLDIEVGTGDLSHWVLRFIARLRQITGTQAVLVYSGAYFFRDHIGETGMDPDVSLWIADYGRTAGQPRYLTPRVAIHQYASDAQVPGITGNADVNVALRPLGEITGGIPDVQLDDTFTDSFGNTQTVRSCLIELMRKVNDIHYPMVAPGSMSSRIPGDSNVTNLQDMIMDSGAWTHTILDAVGRIETKVSDVDEQQLAADLGPVITAAVGPIVREAVTEAAGEDNSALAEEIVAKIGDKLTGGTA